MKKKNITSQDARGYIAIMTVLALMVFSLSLLLSLPLLSIGGGQEALLLVESEITLGALEGCAEDAVLKSVRDEAYIGSTSDYFGIRCDVTIEKDGEQWTLLMQANKNELIRTLVIEGHRSPGNPGAFVLESWLER